MIPERFVAKSAVLLASAAFMLVAPAAAQDAPDPEVQAYITNLETELGGKLMSDPTTIDYNTYGEAKYKTRQVRAADAPGGAAYQVRVTDAGRNPWDATVQAELDHGVAVGDRVSVALWARAAKLPKGKDTAHVSARIQQKVDPYAGVVEGGLEVGPDWALHEFSGTATQAFAADEINVVLNVGDVRQTVEFGQLIVLNRGR